MIKFPSTFDDESLPTYEVSELRTLPLGPARAWLNAPRNQFGLISSKDWRHPCQTAS
jgi:hypothetical protein